MAHYNFQKDVLLGKEAEKDVARLLEEKFDWVLEKSNNDARYDLKFRNTRTNRLVRVEVKSDFMSQHTGNIAIEFSSRGKSSGINRTTAQYWVYKIIYADGHNKYIFITTDAIRKMVANGDYIKTVVGGDYRSFTKMYLFTLATFEKKGKIFIEN